MHKIRLLGGPYHQQELTTEINPDRFRVYSSDGPSTVYVPAPFGYELKVGGEYRVFTVTRYIPEATVPTRFESYVKDEIALLLYAYILLTTTPYTHD